MSFSGRVVGGLALACGLALLACEGPQPEPSAGGSALPIDTVRVALGDSASLAPLYAFPNPDTTLTLAGTIEHYLGQTVERDLVPGASVVVLDSAGTYTALFIGASGQLTEYGTAVKRFHDNGRLALAIADSIRRAGGWGDEWTFFLPVGLAMINQVSVQQLHFPPTAALDRHDYLNDSTSVRWGKLLAANGVDTTLLTLYERIVDADPIATGGAAGGDLPIYAFAEYVDRQLELFVGADPDTTLTRPVVVYGGDARDLIDSLYGIHLTVDSAVHVEVLETHRTPMIGANHPSYIMFFDTATTPYSTLDSVMIQDVTAACWQARLSADWNLPPQETADACREDWSDRPFDICVMIRNQVYHQRIPEAEAWCRSNRPGAGG